MNTATDLRLPFEVRPLTPNLGAEILGVELAKGISAKLFKGIYQAFLRYQVLLFGPQDVPPGDQVEKTCPQRSDSTFSPQAVAIVV